MPRNTVILADGNFPVHKIPLGYLKSAEHIICCDGSAESLVNAGMEPEAIAGDLDSLSTDLKRRFSDRLFQDNDQDTNDLTKAVKWCLGKGYNEIVILGATGKREDHTIGNISLLAEYSKEIKVMMVTDTGIITPLTESTNYSEFRGSAGFNIFDKSGIGYNFGRIKI